MAASGTTKKITSNQILGAGGTATLASATITGDLTVDTSTLKVDSANNRVGIGTATPSVALEVVGNSALSGTTTSSGFIVTGASSVSGAGMWGLSSALAFNVNSTEGMRLNSTGLGVGGSPTTRFEVFSGFIRNTATTGSAQIIAGNTGGVFTLAKDSSTGGNFTGTAYASVLYSDGAYPVCIFTNGSERMRIDASGNLILQSSATPATLTVNGQLTVNATSNTNLRFSYRGSDGTTRVANITLA
jgi:hypothetical protein